jgi:hypothetical protein
VHRLRQREASILFFLADVSVLFGLTFSVDPPRLAFLLLVPLLGLGAAYLYAENNDLIGLLAEYCGIELTAQLGSVVGQRVPLPFDSSSTILSTLTYVKWRLTSSAALILLPQVTAVSTVAISANRTTAVSPCPSRRLATNSSDCAVALCHGVGSSRTADAPPRLACLG